ncbi:MAG TPA: zf-HC2 domain-containing protein [Candidatus Limnocylindrales bacterium]|nr:zf-HC2 domain-containing protein [Candidatus Limnocylindrales bacterium]
MKCEDVSKELIAYLDRRSNSAEREEVEAHLVECAACRSRAEEFRKLWNVLDEVPLVEPSLSFDAKVRQRIAAEPRPSWFQWLVPQPRLAFSMALLVALSIWLARLPQENMATVAPSEQQQFEMIKDLGVLENYEVLTKFDALSELPPPANQPAPKQDEQKEDGGA